MYRNTDNSGYRLLRPNLLLPPLLDRQCLLAMAAMPLRRNQDSLNHRRLPGNQQHRQPRRDPRHRRRHLALPPDTTATLQEPKEPTHTALLHLRRPRRHRVPARLHVR
jgi:hypothetical protein